MLRGISADTLRVAQKCDETTTASMQEIDALIGTFEAARGALLAGTVTVPDALAELKTVVKVSEGVVQHSHRALAAAIASLSKAVDVGMGPGFMLFPDTNATEDTAVLHLVAQQLYHDGHTDIADALVGSASLPFDDALRRAYTEMHSVAKSLTGPCRDVGPALAWCEDVVAAPAATTPTDTSLEAIRLDAMVDAVRTLQFRLHSLRVTQLMATTSRDDAVTHLRTHVTPLARSKSLWRAVQRLTTSLVLPAPLGPDTDMSWAAASDLFLECWCRRYGLPRRAPLQVCVDAGHLVVPSLRKYVELRARTPDMFLQLPPMPSEHTFQSWLCCPVTQQLVTDGDGANPATLLPCAHVISQNALRSLVRPGTLRLKCPYCPTECEASSCIKLFA